jgi:hypothetical protein
MTACVLFSPIRSLVCVVRPPTLPNPAGPAAGLTGCLLLLCSARVRRVASVAPPRAPLALLLPPWRPCSPPPPGL